MTWKTSHDLLSEIQQSYKRFRAGRITASQSRAENDYFKTASKMLAIDLDHAKSTRRLVDGSDVLPSFKIGGIPVAQLEPVAKAKRAAKRTNGKRR